MQKIRKLFKNKIIVFTFEGERNLKPHSIPFEDSEYIGALEGNNHGMNLSDFMDLNTLFDFITVDTRFEVGLSLWVSF